MLQGYSKRFLEHPLIWPDTVEYRLYQKSIAEAALERNTLVILPTALGKTVISAIVAAEILYNYRDSKILVMAPTRPLIMQHRESFMRILKLREKDTALLTGKTPPSHRSLFWNGEARVYFSTPQIVRNDVAEHKLSLEKFRLLVFDECHRTVKEYAYTDIARYYVSQAGYPLILGMTASPGSDLNRVLDVCRNLYVERVEYRSEEDPDVKPYIHAIEVEWKRVNLPPEYLEIRFQIRRMLEKKVNMLVSRGVINRKPDFVTRKILIKAGEELRYTLEAESIEEERGRIFSDIINQSLALTLFHMQELLETQGLHTLKEFMKKVEIEKKEKKSYAILTSDPEYVKLKFKVENTATEHPKTNLLIEDVKVQLERKPSSRTLIFTQYRDTAAHLVNVLNAVRGVRAERFVGQASKLNDKGLSQEEQAERIRMLEDGELNVLVATSIAEEGLDIPAVDHVIFYEPIPSEIRYIQRRGRTGRKTPGKVTILAANESLDTAYLYASRKRTERMRIIGGTVNTKLQAIIRKKPKPPPNPLTPTELEILEQEAKQVKAEPETLKTETETVKELQRKAAKAARTIYMKLLERGPLGATIDQITSDIEYETSIPAVTAALKLLVKQGIVAETGLNQYTVASAVNLKNKKTYEVTIEKIYPGLAVVIVNDKWRARLTPEEYNGPKSLIKKNSKFRAIADLYRTDGKLCIQIKEVTETLK